MQIDIPRQILSLMDLTSLNDADTAVTIAALCQRAITPIGHVAAVCIAPRHVRQAADLLAGTPVKVATVANFPQGDSELDEVLSSIQESIEAGAQEIDVVFPYRDYLARRVDVARNFILRCKQVCGEAVLLKVILETGELKDPQIIADASRDALIAGADFLKTSTGKTEIGATLPAATVIMMEIKEMTDKLNRPFGMKVAGGVRTIEQAVEYIALASKIMGPDWVQPKTFRIGASQLLDALVASVNINR